MKTNEKKECIDNLRVMVKGTLHAIHLNEYRLWAEEYLHQTEPLVDMGYLPDRAKDSIEDLADFQPWTILGKARESWFVVRMVGNTMVRYKEEDYHNASLFALDALRKSQEIANRAGDEIDKATVLLEVSLYGERVS